MDGMLSYSDNGFLPTLYADAIKNGSYKAIAEYANFLNQLSDIKQERVNGFEQEVMNKLPKNTKQAVMAYTIQNDEQDVKQNENQNQHSSQTSDDDYQDSQECMDLKTGFDHAKSEAKKYEDDYYDKRDEMTRLGDEADEAEQEIRDTVYETAKDITLYSFFELVTSGSVERAIEWLKKRIKRPLDWAKIAYNAWIIYNNMEKIEELETKSNDDYDEWQAWLDEAKKIRQRAIGHDCKIHGW